MINMDPNSEDYCFTCNNERYVENGLIPCADCSSPIGDSNMKKDYFIGTLHQFGIWTDLRCALGSLCQGRLTPELTSAGESVWTVSVRSTGRLSTLELSQVTGFFYGFLAARNAN